ncbi:c-type cytochrome [Diaphorobacter sp.]|uniref:c-type cytochrome n=1 Tax=Diaphorobacter sp. TaxID=1934310 RepID=UPI0028A7E092|nr:c-type cytochrome [Diaphorobacter sp.]
MPRKSFRLLSPLRCAWLGLLLASPLVAHAASSAPSTSSTPSTSLTPQDVALLAASCINCHGPQGQSRGGIPPLAGQTQAHLRQRMLDFQAGTATDATVMTRLMKGYDSAQIEALAQWFSGALAKGGQR